MQYDHQALGLSDNQVVEMYWYMLMARELDKRTWLLNRAGKIPFVISCQGQEAAQVGAAYALNPKQDFLCPYYRDMAMVLVFGMTPTDLMLSSFAKRDDPNSGGRQMPGHFGGRKYRIISGSSPVTTQVPHGVGVALAARMRRESTVVLVAFGEGSSNQGDFHEGANFAGVFNLPVILFCENNQYAISVPLEKQVAGGSVAARAKGYGMPGVTVDGNDVLAVYKAVSDAVKRARANQGPTLIEAITYRLVPHSSDDDDRTYRSREEVEEAKGRDPIVRFERYLVEHDILDTAALNDLHSKVMIEVDQATDEAEHAPYPQPESTLDHVYSS